MTIVEVITHDPIAFGVVVLVSLVIAIALYRSMT